ncbi:hypothetical protein FOA52_000555 [Chlamydomonas sp. UWO 241]|nr:hypothetical protein FOA52_000555 [Chlamydomonas sp. UWO 241]
MESLIPAVMAQDADGGFRELVVEQVNQVEAIASMVPGCQPAADDKAGTNIIVFVVQNSVTLRALNTALYLARPGRDRLHLVTVVASGLAISQGQQLLAEYQRIATRSMMDKVSPVVLVRSTAGLLDAMEKYVVEVALSGNNAMVVMGSAQITSSGIDSAMGSVTLAFVRRMVGLPVIVVTQNSRNSPGPASKGLRVMLNVEPHARALLAMVCTRLLAPRGRADQLLLAQASVQRNLTRQQAANNRRLFDNFAHLARAHGCPAVRTYHLEGQADEALTAASDEYGVGLVALQLPTGSRGLAPSLLALIRSCRGGALVFQEATAGDKSAILTQFKEQERKSD